MTKADRLCIDLGAAFTKIAYRTTPPADTTLLVHPDLDDEQKVCIPSVAARNPHTGGWVFGQSAAGLRPGPRVEVHDNWKSELFDPNGPTPRAREVMERFLRWLYEVQLPEMSKDAEARAAPVQLCVPEFVVHSPTAAQLGQLLAEIGFVNPEVVSEPRTNLVGVLTEGRNLLTVDGVPDLYGMITDLSVLRTLSTPGQGVVVIDIGAFTTDLALAGYGDAGPDPAASTRLGVRQLVAWLLASAPPSARDRIGAESALEREHFHRLVFGGTAGHKELEEYELTPEVIDSAIERFAERLLDEVDLFLDRAKAHMSFNAILTGGGAKIRGVTRQLAHGLAERGVGALHAPFAVDAPTPVEPYLLGPGLVRAGSAIGGCSILGSV